MTAVELDRVEVIRWVLDGRLSQIKAAVQLDRTPEFQDVLQTQQ